MKTLLAALAAAAALAGCVAVPVEPAPVIYAPRPPVVYAAPPPPAVVVRPYVYGRYYYGHPPYWRHSWR